MKIVSKLIPVRSIQQFADDKDLTMVVGERPEALGSPMRYYAHFKDCEIKDGNILCGAYGNGSTPEAAIESYAKEISLKRIVISAYRGTRRELDVPRILPNEKVDRASATEFANHNNPSSPAPVERLDGPALVAK